MVSGFRNSLFGFKKSDVIDYIDQWHRKSADREADLLRKIEELNEEISSLKSDIDTINQEKKRIENIQDEYIKRYEEVEKLSADIGKLYLTAQTDAKEVMEQSIKSRELVNKEVETNLTAIEEMHAELGNVKSDILSSVGNFSNELDRLFATFNEAKEKLAEHTFTEE